MASQRAEALAGAFQRWCLSAAPSYDALDARAAAAGLVIEHSDSTDTPDEGLVKTKLWTVANDPTGAYSLSDGFALKKGKAVTVCELSAQDAAGDDVLQAVSRGDYLGPALATRTSDDGVQRLTEFKAPYPHSSILLADGTPQRAGGVILNIIEVREPGR
jgi:hypothetical protein